jgi:hypothetical protein
VSNLLLFPPLALAAGAAGAAQVGAILSQPEPKPPAFALGGTVRGATAIIAGEDRGDVLLGMGAKGAPLIEELATRIATIGQGSSAGQTVNFYSMVNVTDPQQMRFFAQQINPFLEEVQEGRL